MMSMTFHVSSRVTLLFDFWDVRGPEGMVLSVLVVLLLTVFYEVLKVWRVWLESRSKLAQPWSKHSTPPISRESAATLDSRPSESSLTPIAPHNSGENIRNSWLLRIIQTVLHMLQVTVGYMLMLCAMSYNVWIFLGIIMGSALGYFISFPFVGHV